jgi:hypothetical protein
MFVPHGRSVRMVLNIAAVRQRAAASDLANRESRPPDMAVAVCHARSRRYRGKRNRGKCLGASASE